MGIAVICSEGKTLKMTSYRLRLVRFIFFSVICWRTFSVQHVFLWILLFNFLIKLFTYQNKSAGVHLYVSSWNFIDCQD